MNPNVPHGSRPAFAWVNAWPMNPVLLLYVAFEPLVLTAMAAAFNVLTVSSSEQTVPAPASAKAKARLRGSPRPGATFHPQGSLLYRLEAQRPTTARLIAAAVFVGCAGLLALAGYLEPDPSGMGTHQQLGFPTCTMVMLFGYPCPTCGMTTAFAHAVRGELISAFNAQPAGLVLALVAILAASVALGVAATGKVWAVNWYRISPALVTLLAVLVVLGGWIYKIAAGVFEGTLPAGR